MPEPWFSPEAAPWFSMLSLFSLLAYLQIYALKGKYRQWVMGSYYTATGFALLLALIGAVAMPLGQPDWVWGTLIFVGVLTFVLMWFSNRKVARMYSEAELRKSIAGDL